MASLEERVLLDWIRDLFEKQKSRTHELATEPVTNRRTRLVNLRAAVLRHQSRIRKAIHNDFRKPETESDATEIFPVLDEITLALANLRTWTRPRKVDAPITMLGTRSSVYYEPKGVCLIMAPWNYPFNLCMAPLVSALAAGNAVILKPSELTPHTSSIIKTICEEVFDDHEVAVCEGGVEVSRQLLQLPFDHIFFTGSPAVGKIVMRAAAEHLTSVTLELGGKSPTIITPSANLKEAARRIAVAKFINNGQTCIAPDYILVHESVASAWVKHVKEEVLRLFANPGEHLIRSPHYARIVNEQHYQRLSGLLTDAIERGAHIELTGDMDASQRFFYPTILTEVPADARVMEEEIFGPILPVLTYRSIDEAIRQVTARPKPLALYIYGDDRREQEQIVRATSAGGVCINDSAIHFLHHNLPFGGVNTSGIGKAHGYHGFLAFSNEKPVLRQRHGMTSVGFLYPPYTPMVQRMMRMLIRLFS